MKSAMPPNTPPIMTRLAIGSDDLGAAWRKRSRASIKLFVRANYRAHLGSTTIWSAPAERSGDGALALCNTPAEAKAVSRFACHRTPYRVISKHLVVLPRCARPRSFSALKYNESVHRSRKACSVPKPSSHFPVFNFPVFAFPFFCPIIFLSVAPSCGISWHGLCWRVAGFCCCRAVP